MNKGIGKTFHVASILDLENVFASVVVIALSAAGMAAVVMLIIGGYKFIAAGGDKDATQKAGQTITYAIGGLIFVLASWIILNLVGNFLGVNFSVFKITI